MTSAYTLDDQQQAAEDWFRSLRDRIIAEFEQIETEGATLPALPNAPSEPGRFTYTPWQRADHRLSLIHI